MKSATTLNNEARQLFIDALNARVSDKKTRDVASINKKGGGKYASFIAQVLKEVEAGMVVWNAFHTVVNRHEAERSALMQSFGWVRANFTPEATMKYDGFLSGFAAANLLQQLMNSACWSERRGLRNQTLDEGQVAEIDYEAAGGIDVPDTADQHHDANQRLQKLAGILLHLQSGVYTSTDAAFTVDPLVLFSDDRRVEVNGETQFVRAAAADTFEDALQLMTESLEAMRTEEQAAAAEKAATYDYEAA